MGLSCTVSEIDDDFSRKSQNFRTPMYFAPLLRGLSLELGISAGGQKTGMTVYQADKEIWRYLQPYGYNSPTWRTDGRTQGDSKDRADA